MGHMKKFGSIFGVLLIIGFSIVIMLLLILFVNGPKSFSNISSPEAEKAMIDLSDWDFEEDIPANLSGEWEFYWNKLLEPEDFNGSETFKNHYEIVPSKWNNYTINGENLPNSGFATYRVRFKLKEQDSLLTLIIPYTTFPYKVWFNGECIKTNLKGGTTGNSNEIDYLSQYYTFKAENKVNELILQTFSYNDKISGGTFNNFSLCNFDYAIKTRELYIIIEIIIMSIIIFMAFYHFVVYFFNRKNKAYLMLALSCTVLGLRIITSDVAYRGIGKFVLTFLFRDQNVEIGKKIEFSTLILAPLMLVMFINSLFPYDIPKKLICFFQIVSAIFVLIFITTSYDTYRIGIKIYQVFIVLMGISIVYYAVNALLKKREGSIFIGIGLPVLFVAMINDILPYWGIVLITEQQTIFYGIFLFFLFQACFLALKFSRSFDTIEAISVELETKNIELQKMDKLKDEFLANTSHELRTPLNGIIGIVDSILGGATGRISESQKYNLSLVLSSARRLTNLVGDILDFSKLKNSEVKLEIKPVDIKSVVDIVLSVCKSLVNSKELKLINNIKSDIPLVNADENRLEQILHNLIGNAIKFTKEGKITVNANIKDDYVEVSIKDTGIGIAKNQLENIFESFEQLNGTISRNYGGTGIGLSITKKLVELHHGIIYAKSNIEKGSTFYFTLPVSEVKKHKYIDIKKEIPNEIISTDEEDEIVYYDNQNLNMKNKNNKNINILVVDDDIINLQVIFNQFSIEDYLVTTVTNGEDALKLIFNGKKFDIVLLDIMMPNISGYQVCKKIREKYTLFELPILMLTAKNQPQDIITCFEMGANDFVNKPFDKMVLLARVKTLLSLKQSIELYQINERLKMEMAKERELEDNRRELFSMITHELKSPLTAVKGQLEAMIRCLGVFKDRDKYLRKSYKIMGEMEILLYQIIQIAKLEQHKFIPNNKKVDLSKLIKKTIIKVEYFANKKNIDIIENVAENEEKFIISDDELLEKAIYNIIHNGIMYSNSGENVIIEFFEKDEFFVLTVLNTGTKIEEDKLPKIFNPFYRGELFKNKNPNGNGLGLYLVKKIFETLSVNYSIKNVKKGVLFSVEFKK